MCDVRFVKVAPLIEGGITSLIEDVRRRAVVIRGPFHKMIRNIKRGWIWAGVLEIDNNYLGTIGGLAPCGRLTSLILPGGGPWGSVGWGSSATSFHTGCRCGLALSDWRLPWPRRARPIAYISPIGRRRSRD